MLPEYSLYGCPELPVVNANMTVAERTDGRRLQRTDESTPVDMSAQLRQGLRAFYVSKGLSTDNADIYIEFNATLNRYSIELATSRTGAVYLAYVINTDLQGFVAESSFSVTVGNIEVRVDGLNCQASQSCEASGSFLGGSL